jgi:hypothetical protein
MSHKPFYKYHSDSVSEIFTDFHFIAQFLFSKPCTTGVFVFVIIECTTFGLVISRSEYINSSDGYGVYCANREQVATPHDVCLALSAGQELCGPCYTLPWPPSAVAHHRQICHPQEDRSSG